MRTIWVVVHVRKFILLLIPLVIVNCTSNMKGKVESLPAIVVVDSLFLHLDQETSNKFTSPQVINIEGNPYLVNTFFDFSFLKFFDLNTGECTQTLKFNDTGPNKISAVAGTYFIDSSLFFVKGMADEIYNGKFTNNISIKKIIVREKGRYWFVPKIDNNLHPVIGLNKNKFLISNSHQYRKGRNAFNIIDTSTNDFTQAVQFPDQFIEGFFGVYDFREWNYVYNKKSQLIIANYPNLDTLYGYDINLNPFGKYFVESSIKTSPIKKIFQKKNYTDPDDVTNPKEINLRVKSNLQYKALLYDEKNNYYYRIVGHPISQYKIESEDPVISQIRNYSIMVIDSNFNLVNEFAIPFNKYLIYNVCFFLYEGHLYIQRLNQNEDTVLFDKLKLI